MSFKTQPTLPSLIFMFFVAFGMASCQEEEPLKPYEDGTGISQNQNFDGSGIGSGRGGSGSGGTGGSGGGSANLPSEYFSVNVDGISNSNNDPFYQEGLGQYQVINNALVLDGQIQITFFSEPQDTTYTNPFIGYFQSATSSYQSVDGELSLDTVTADYMSGTFFCNTVNSFTSDTVELTNGRFLVWR